MFPEKRLYLGNMAFWLELWLRSSLSLSLQMRAHHSEVERLGSEKQLLQEQMRERERIVRLLQQETASLTQQHRDTLREVGK